ncbi:hypothetical protein DFJ74DRAFT_606189 [Hyaloraphidium curvatum]|nr:hypothetical protein DFJ74DRAFT_606189 [Hyaloraphidium curvatum]
MTATVQSLQQRILPKAEAATPAGKRNWRAPRHVLALPTVLPPCLADAGATAADVDRVIGTEISGIALAALTDEQVRAVEALVAQRGVLFFRNQKMTLKEHVELGKRFGTGELHVHPNAAGPKGFPEVLPVYGDRNSNVVAGEVWHTDVSCDRRPPALSILRIEQAPRVGGDTMWASMTALYKKLPRQTRARLEGLTAVHDSRTAGHRAKETDVNGKEPELPRHVHPVIRTHPITGERALYVNSGFTSRIEGVPEEESAKLLKELFDLIAYSNEAHVRWKWSDDCVAIWDNRVTQHTALWTYFPYTRSGYRVTTLGEEPFFDPSKGKLGSTEALEAQLDALAMEEDRKWKAARAKI